MNRTLLKRGNDQLVSASRDYCATRCTEREITVERIQELRKGLSGSNIHLKYYLMIVIVNHVQVLQLH